MPVENIEHTADIRMRAWGRSFQVTLLELANRMLEMMYGKLIEPDSLIGSEIQYDSNENCVARLLNDIIYKSESSHLAIRVRLITVCNRMVRWEGFGEFVGKRERGSILVKAATYDRIKVIKDPPLIEITLDI